MSLSTFHATIICSSQSSAKSPQFSTAKKVSPPDLPALSRRALGAAVVLGAFLADTPSSQAAREGIVAKEVDNATSPLIQEMLRKTEEKREERKKDRLNDYYRRNYTDYFSFQSGAGSNMDGEGISAETQAKIKQWLKDNSQ